VEYVYSGDSLIFRGMADPTLLHPDFSAWQPWFATLRTTEKDVFYESRDFAEPRFGAGWAWDDYNDDYQAERSIMPVYGNAIRLILNRTDARVEPPFFQSNVVFLQPGAPDRGKGVTRAEHANIWYIPESVRETDGFFPIYAPDPALLLSDTLRKPLARLAATEVRDWRMYYSVPLDTVLRRMMHQSDNFVAEQLLLSCAAVKWGIPSQDTLMRWMLDSVWHLPQRPRWVDGSGLSRYNLATPHDMAQILRMLWNTCPEERLLSLFPAGGEEGTLRDWYAGENGTPYVFAKTGSMSGVHCLSGYVRCKSGKVLVFSFMHNNFTGSNRAWKIEMQGILERIRDNF
jgi:D-alanyl-D-alanine carboxypeptidase/D-alanyl-D-alanine-endopeptidase (penicillin-binding protein 4)